jgi:two-component system, chemotaxis family, protein-glutamate methylesterase/glutaminase
MRADLHVAVRQQRHDPSEVAVAGHDIVVIGGSAGGVEALKRICAGLPRDFPAAIFVVLHISPTSRSVLPDLLSRAGHLPAHHPKDNEAIRPGIVYVAPPDMHMLLRPGHVILRRGPHENRTRPAIDPLFRSAAVAYRSQVIGVVLSGLLDDGSAGLAAINACGGICVVQEPNDAIWPEMPRNALAHDRVDHCTPVAELPGLLSQLVQQPPGTMLAIPRHLIVESSIAAQEAPIVPRPTQVGRPSRLSCPQCGGVLDEVTEEGIARFRCQIGHAFTAEALVAAQDEELERALESALRMHRERVVLFRRMQEKSEVQSLPHAAARWRAGADESEHAAKVIADAINGLRKPSHLADAH